MGLEEELQSTNTELRFITLELMKIAERRKTSFREIAKEYVQNVHFMQRTVEENIKSSQETNHPESISD
ncbi:MAG: hypothetical protein PHU63_01440 [Candidatus ainarchaeum sp.]|nr:hypothetical protein [Candidatus ainarchaeum sp.]